MNNVVTALIAVVDDDHELSAPVAAAYKSHSSNIVDVLNDLLDKAQIELDDTRHAESNAARNFAILKQSLEGCNKDLEKAKADVAEFTASLDAAKPDLAEAEKSLAALVVSQAASKTSCVQVASEHEASLKAYAEELKALADATQVLHSETDGTEGQTLSLFQESSSAGLQTSATGTPSTTMRHAAQVSLRLAVRTARSHPSRPASCQPVVCLQWASKRDDQ